MPNLTTLTAQQQLDALAAETVACDDAICTQNREATRKGLPVVDMLDECQGTGTVARFPMLRELRSSHNFMPCPGAPECAHTDLHAHSQMTPSGGWRPKQVEDVHFEDIVDAPIISKTDAKVILGYLEGSILGAIAALYAAVQAQKEEAHDA